MKAAAQLRVGQAGRANRTFSPTVASNRKPSCGTITTRGAASRTGPRAAAPRTAAPSPARRVHQPGDQLGEGGLAAAGLAHHGHPALRRNRPDPPRAAPAGRPDRRTARRANRTSSGPAGSSRPCSPGSATSGATSSTSSTRRQPAIAFCASLSTSVAICTGWMNSVTRNRNAVSWPIDSVPSTPSVTPTHHHAGQRQPGRQLPDRAAHDADPDRPLLGHAAAPRSPRPAAARCARRSRTPGSPARPPRSR